MYFHVFASYSDSLLLGFCLTNIIILFAKKGEKVPKFSLFPLSATCEALRFINVHEHASIEVCRCLWNYDQCTVALYGYLDDRMLEFFSKEKEFFQNLILNFPFYVCCRLIPTHCKTIRHILL